MALYPGTVIRRYPLIYRFAGVSPGPSSPLYNPNGVLASSIPKFGFRASSSFQSLAHSSSSSHGTGFKNLGWSEMKFGHTIFDYFRVSASSDRGVSGIGGGFGGSGDGNSGGRGEGAGDGEGGGSKWSLLSWYLSVLEKYPVLTKAITSAILTFVGDLICQLLIDQVSTLDCKRTFLFTFLGFALVGPTLHFWYLYLSKLVTLQGASGALLRLLLDQFIFSPIFIGVFLSTLVTLEGRPSQVVPKLQQEWFSAVLANWQLWIPFQFLNFRFVPQQFQVLAANVVALAWNVILSFKAHKEVITK
ncbi:PREDICTED: protein sym-1 [Nelumbo nucifera]|uniref:Protein sym-1 n=1 Tax=Nelumbo nucifera TaxID=4432 RepID=A0A1U7ZU11_NELNU|nr:PREDICTED: protein sym-1 [Nelumbo nucifera]